MSSLKIIEKISNFISSFLENFSSKMKVFSLKKFTDWLFVIIEKILIKMDKLLPLYVYYYEDIIDNELKIAKISSSDEILHIGCGSIPSTAILLKKKTGAKITAIDIDTNAIKKSYISVKKMNLSDEINFKHTDVLNLAINKFNVIVISQGIEPRYDTLKYILKSMKNDAQIIYRTFSDNGGKLTDDDMLLKDLFKIENQISQKKHGLLLSVLLSKK